MSQCRLPALFLALMLTSACVQLPEEANMGEGAHDAGGWLSLLLDAGMRRPDTGEPYHPPDCLPAQLPPSPDHLGAMMDGGYLTDGGVWPGMSVVGALDGGSPMQQTPVVAGDLVFTEVMANPATLDDRDGEWFELALASSVLAPRNIEGCVLGDGAGEAHVVDSALWLEPGDHAVFARGPMPGFTPDYVFSFSLKNSDDRLVLTCQGTEIDALSYGGGFPLASGASMALDPRFTSAVDNDSAQSWCLAVSSFGGDMGSPGAANPPCRGLDSDAGVAD